MAQKTIRGNEALAKQIKNRRNELGLTIEEAAARSGVGTKTWCRYEAGESIRTDKCKGVCKALNWRVLPDQETEDSDILAVHEYKNHEAWSSFLEETFGMWRLSLLLWAVISCLIISKRICGNCLPCRQDLISDK